MKIQYKSSEDFYNKLNLVFNGIIAGTLLPFAIVFLGRQKDKFDALMEGTPAILLTVILLLFAGFLIFDAFKRYKNSFAGFNKSATLREKMDFYYAATIRRYMMLGGASICAILGLLLNTHQVFVLAYLAVIFVFSLARPDARKLPEILALDDDEKQIVLEKREIK